ncbi:MAG: HIT domain-containing protein [Alphaproteobacteria bacterium]|nr:HIT domain-containing protein [Alphaproteobacteria bacterium]
MPFALHERLQQDTFQVAQLPLCDVLLMDDKRFPWLILVPREENIREITDLDQPNRLLLMEEIAEASGLLQHLTRAHKMNVAALGNMVPQLHIHVIARFEEDAAWPNPVWGSGREQYTAEEAERALAQLRSLFDANNR